MSKKPGFATGVVLGAVLGTGIAVLSQADKQKEVNKKLKQVFTDLADKHPETTTQLQASAAELLQELGLGDAQKD